MKKLFALALVLLCIVVFSVSTFAVSEYDIGEYVNDEADLLSDAEEQELENIINGIREKFDFDVAICTVMSTDGEDIDTYAENYYITSLFSFDGLVFIINLNNNESGNREFYTYYQGSVYNTFGDEAYDSDNGYINEHILSYLVIEDYYSAFKEYLTLTESFAEDYFGGRTDDNYDYYYNGTDGYYYNGSYGNSTSLRSIVIKEIIVVVLGAVAAFLITQIMKSKMNTAVMKHEASDYVKEGSFNVTKSFDVFTYKNIVTTPKAQPANNVNHGGGGHTGGGFSGGGGHSGGGGGKF